MRRIVTSGTTWATLALLLGVGAGAGVAQDASPSKTKPVTIATQGSFFAGGTVITTANGQLFHGDHAYFQYQIPPDARDLPLVMWHGGGQSGKSWESTPDGREGYQTIFLRRGFAVYLLDQPRMGRAGRSTAGATLTPTGNAATVWNIFRLGIGASLPLPIK